MMMMWHMYAVMLGASEEAAETEPAWKGAGQEVGLQIWRIVVSIYTTYTHASSNSQNSSR